MKWAYLLLLFHIQVVYLISASPPPPIRPGMSMADCLTALRWSSENVDFYDNFPVEDFESQAKACGLDKLSDLEQPRLAALLSYRRSLPEEDFPAPTHFKAPDTVLIVGAGYGRETAGLIAHTRIKNFLLVEHSKIYAKHLRRAFARDKLPKEDIRRHIGIFNQNIVDVAIQEWADIALWLWMGIFELSPEQKPLGLRKTYEALKPGGMLVIDVPVDLTLGRLDTSDKERFKEARGIMKVNLKKAPEKYHLNLHLLEKDDLIQIAKNVGFRDSGCESYTATPPPPAPPKRRMLCFLAKD